MTDQETMFDLWQEELQIRKEELVKSIAEQFEFNAKEVEERVMESSARQRDALYSLSAESTKMKEVQFTDHENFTWKQHMLENKEKEYVLCLHCK